MKKLLTLLVLLVAIVTGAKAGEEFSITPSFSKNNAILGYGLITIAKAGTVGNCKFGSSKIQANSSNQTFEFTIQTTYNGVTLKSITFNSIDKLAESGFTAVGGDLVIDGTNATFTPTGDKTTATFTCVSASGKTGSVKITDIKVDGGTNEIETISTFTGKTDNNFAFITKKEGVTVDNDVTISSADATSSSNNISWGNNKVITISATENINFVGFIADEDINKSSFVTTDVETYSNTAWSGSAKSISFTNKTGGGRTLYTIYLIKEASKTVATQEYAGVKKGGATLTAGDDFTLSEQVITLADKYAASAAPTDIQLINHRTYTDTSDDYADVDVEFSAASEGYFVGTTTIGLSTYTVKVPEIESYTVSYNAGAYGSGSIASGKKYKNVDFTLSSETFTREGFVQSGWATTDGGEKAYDLGGTYSENVAIELFPAWTEANTYFAAFSVAEGTPAGWTFSIPDPDTWADNNARVAFVKDFADNGVATPKTNNLGDSYIAFAKSADGYALYDLGSSVTVFGITAQLYGGSSSAFNIKIDYLGADATTVQKSYTVSLSAGNWNLNTITKSDVVNDVRYIKIYGGTKWVVMSGFSVTSTADAIATGAKITTNAGKWASFTPTYNAIVPAGTEAYIITGIGAGAILEGNTVSVMEAGKGYFIKGEASTEYTATYTTEAADATDGNMLVGCAKDAALAVNSGANPYQYFLGTDQDTQKAGLFYVGANAVTIPAGKCYLLSNSNTPLSLSLPFEGDPTAIINVNANDNADTVAPIKIIKGGQLFIGNYNVAGQQVK